jgi:Tol biopolymer transport system component
MVYVTDRNGALEIWLHRPGLPDRPVVTPNDFPADATRGFIGLALSPDATRVIYGRISQSGSGGLYLSALAGGAPVRLLDAVATSSGSGSWSPDGQWFVYMHLEEGRRSLNKVKTTGGATPVILKADLPRTVQWLPAWSPANDWILFAGPRATLISPDGQTTRELSSTTAAACTFSADGRTVYGIRTIASDRDRVALFAIDVASASERTIGALSRAYLPSAGFSPGLRLSLTPDGKAITYGVSRSTSNLWLMDGLQTVIAR